MDCLPAKYNVSNGPSLPFDFKFPFQSKSIFMKSDLINKVLSTRTTNEKQYASKSKNQSGFECQFEI